MPAVVWKRFDCPGHDACRLMPDGGLDGMAVWYDGVPGAIRYRVDCNDDGTTRRARLDGLDGDTPVTLDVHRDASGRWQLNGDGVLAVVGALDIDLGFTPATNTLPIRRLELAEGDSADLIAAWIDPKDWTLKSLQQRYTRLAADRWVYESRDGSFQAELLVTDQGLVRNYGTRWAEVSSDGT